MGVARICSSILRDRCARSWGPWRGRYRLTELQKHLIRSVAGLVVLRERLDAGKGTKA